MHQLDITTLSPTELKALAWDESVKINIASANIQLINAELAKRDVTPLTDSVPLVEMPDDTSEPTETEAPITEPEAVTT